MVEGQNLVLADCFFFFSNKNLWANARPLSVKQSTAYITLVLCTVVLYPVS